MADIGCSTNAVAAFDFLANRGLTYEQAAGVIGNLQWESSLNPDLEAMDTDGHLHRGIAMWSPTRWQDLLTFVASRGFDPKSLEGQLWFLWHELENQPALGLRELASTRTVEDATVAFQNRFENPNPALAHTDKRIALARAALFSLPKCRPPGPSRRPGIVAASIGLLSLVAAAGYGAYKALRAL